MRRSAGGHGGDAADAPTWYDDNDRDGYGNDDTAGALRAIRTVTTGLSWRQVAEPVSVVGAPSQADRASIGELAATVGAYALGLID